MKIAIEIACRYLASIAGALVIQFLIFAICGEELLANEKASVNVSHAALFSLLVAIPILESGLALAIFSAVRKSSSNVGAALVSTFLVFVLAHGMFSWIWALTIAPLAGVSAHAFAIPRRLLVSAVVIFAVHFLFNMTGYMLRQTFST